MVKMMTGTIFDIKKFAIHDGPGIRTTAFLKGCPLHCWWCHNPEGINGNLEELGVEQGKAVGKEISVDAVIEEIEKDKIFYDESNGGATFSGGEPMAQIDFLRALLEKCKKLKIHTVVDTSGYARWEDFEKILDCVDLFLYDLKFINNNLHQKYTGISNDLILDNLKKLDAAGKEIELRIPVIPGLTDTNQNLDDIAGFVKQLKNIDKISLLPYNKLAEDKCSRFNLPNKIGKLETQSDDQMVLIGERFSSDKYDVKIGG